jgi:hypothetical protein
MIVTAGLALAACGGTQSKGSGSGGGGGGGEATADAGMASAWGGGGPDGGAAGPEVPGSTTAPAGPPPVVTFVLENKGKSDLVFPIDKGWQTQLTAYTGKKPHAVAAILFAKACTESCEAAPETVCPDCAEEEDIKKRHQQERDETKREVAPVGGAVEVPWDGKVVAYEKAPKGVGPKKKCECWRKVDPEPGLYTIMACGIRPAAKAGDASKPACAETKIDLPPAQPGGRVTISFSK